MDSLGLCGLGISVSLMPTPSIPMKHYNANPIARSQSIRPATGNAIFASMGNMRTKMFASMPAQMAQPH